MNVTFQVVPTIAEDERKLLFDWAPDVFQGEHYGIQWRPADVHVVGYVDGHPATHVGVVSHHVQVGATICFVGGIGGVVTPLRFQKQGLARKCLQRAEEYLRSELAVEYGFLFCQDRLVPFYQASGWRKINEVVLIEQPLGQIESPVGCMVREYGDSWPVGPVTLHSWPW
ncbi:MAG: GNAT family N-acetyltransferase [Planctomycetota bacterium]|nr:GNAT family N-acetyltransferase [Planctomycetota bacterium]